MVSRSAAWESNFQRGVETELIIVDDRSTDRTAEEKGTHEIGSRPGAFFENDLQEKGFRFSHQTRNFSRIWR